MSAARRVWHDDERERARATPRRPIPTPGTRLVGRVESYDVIRGGRVYVEDRGYFHFAATAWRGGGVPRLGHTVAFTVTGSGAARDVRRDVRP